MMRGFVAGVLAVVVVIGLVWGATRLPWVQSVRTMSAEIGQFTDKDGVVHKVTVADVAALLAQAHIAQLAEQQKQQSQAPATPPTTPK